MRVLEFMCSVAGRILRGILGVVLLAGGGSLLPAGLGVLLVILGLPVLFAAVFDLCLIGPLFGAPVQGSRIRE